MSRLRIRARRQLWFACAAGAWLVGACVSGGEALATKRETFRVQAPLVASDPEIRLPAFEAAHLGNELSVLVSEQHTPRLVHIELALAAGSGDDPRLRAGLARLAYAWLLQGAGPYAAPVLEAAFVSLGATPTLHVGPDGARLSVTVLSERAEAALALLAEVAQHPWLDDAGFARCKSQQLADLAGRRDDPVAQARRAFAAEAYGSEHPYGHSPLGARADLAPLDAATVRAFYAQRVGPGTTALIVTGDITLPTAFALAARYLGQWRSPAQRTPAPPPVAPQVSGQIVRVARPGWARTLLLVGRPALAASAADDAALEIAVAAMGGMWNSRLQRVLRSQPGVGYVTEVRFDARRGPGPWLAQANVCAACTADALLALLSTLGALPVNPFSDRETEAARHSLIASLPGRLQGADNLARALARMFQLKQPLDAYTQRMAALRDAPAGDVESAGVTYLSPAGLTIVVVGDPGVLDAQLQRVQLDSLRTLRQTDHSQRPPNSPRLRSASGGLGPSQARNTRLPN